MVTSKTANSNKWIWSVVRGVIALALGIFLMASDATATKAVAYALATYIAITGGLQTFSGLLNRDAPGSTTDRLRGLVGLIGGVALLVLLYFTQTSLPLIYTILAILAIVYGVLGLFESFFDRGGQYFSWMPVIVNALLVLLGALVFLSRPDRFNLQLWSGVVLTVMGAGIIGYAYLVQKPKPAVLASNL